MNTLEDLLPEMAGVFAAQESALENCVAVLSTQLQNLGADCTRQLRRVVALETSQRAVQSMITTLQEAVAAIQQQNEQLIQQHAAQTEELMTLRDLASAASSVDLSGFRATLAHEMEAQTASVVQTIVTEQLTIMENKLSEQMNQRMLEASNRAFHQAQQSEELLQGKLEMLEKKFDFLSKIKMEIKDLGKRMDKQDQTMDDMRTGLALLAKSVGSDDIDDDEEDSRSADTSSQRKPSRLAEPQLAAMPIVVPLDESIEESTNVVAAPSPQVELLPEPQQPMIEEDQALEIPDDEPLDVELPVDEVEVPLKTSESSLDEKTDSAEVLDEEKTEVEPTQAVSVDEPQEQEQTSVAVDQQPEETSMVTPAVEDEIPEAQQPESETPPPSELQPEVPLTESDPPPAEDEQLPASQSAELPIISTTSEPAAPEPVPLSIEPHATQPLTPKQVQTPKSDASDDETEENDPFDGVSSLPVHAIHRPSHPTLQHMPTAPSLSTVAYIRSRRQERTAKRGSRRESTLDLSDQPPSKRIPLSREEIKELWFRIFNKIVQLKRLQSINGTSPERTLFRKQNLSMGARVKRLEEASVDLEDTVELLESSIHNNGTTIQALSDVVTQSNTMLDKKTKKLDEVQRMQAQSIVGIEEKFEAFEAEFRRMRNVARRDSSQGSVTSALMSQVATQIHDLTQRIGDQTKSVEDHESKLRQLFLTDLPSLTTNVQSTVLELRAEVDYKTRELGKDLVKAVDALRAGQTASKQQLETQIADYAESLYRDLLVLTSAILVSVELAARHASGKSAASPTKKAKQKSALDVSIALLHSVIGTFETECRKTLATSDNDAETSDSGALVSIVFEKLQQFRAELTKLKDQADKSAAITSVGELSGGSRTKGFEDHLVLACTNQLRALEEVLVSQSHLASQHASESDTRGEIALIVARVKDLVIQFRAVLFLLVTHAQLVEPPEQIHALQLAQASMESKLTSQEYALSQLATVEAVVKMMNSRLDSFMDMSFSFAKDADVKRSIQEMFNAHDELRDTVVKQVDTTHGEALKRDELMEREITQLAGRVQKKLDKDEMLWTQEVLERQLQNVAKGALGEEDLVDIQRALRTKMDKTQFQALLALQHAKLQELGAGNGTLSLYGGSGGNQPLAATRCISCDGELPPSASQMRAAVREEVQQEVAKALAAAKHQPQQSSSSTSSPPVFNASSHRSMDKHKRELLMTALQQQQQRK